MECDIFIKETREWIEFNLEDLENIERILPKGTKNITINIENTKNKYNVNWEQLRTKNFNIMIKYGSVLAEKLPLEDFITYRENLKNIRNKLITPQMSPYEKLLAVYQYAISYPYVFYSGMGSAHNFISENSTGKICEDYCSIIKELLSEEKDIDLSKTTISCIHENKVGSHTELMIRIDDDKYQIHGIYMLDPTNDSYVESWKDFFGSDFSPGEIFDRFMLPLLSDKVYDYKGVQLKFTLAYPLDVLVNKSVSKEELLSQTKEQVIEIITSQDETVKEDYEEFLDEINPVIESVPQNQLEQYVKTTEVPFTKTIDALITIMHLQGKPSKEITESINRIINNYNRINKTKLDKMEESTLKIR